jgi:hypothetical protein
MDISQCTTSKLGGGGGAGSGWHTCDAWLNEEADLPVILYKDMVNGV